MSAPSVVTSFSGVTLNGKVQTTSSTLSSWKVVDSTGSGNGWHVSLSATQLTEDTPTNGFASGTSALKPPVGSVQLSGTRTVTVGDGSAPLSSSGGPLIDNPTAVIDGQSPFTLLDAKSGFGLGTYTVNEPSDGLVLTLNPSTTKVDSVNYPNEPTPYSTTLTYSVTSSP